MTSTQQLAMQKGYGNEANRSRSPYPKATAHGSPYQVDDRKVEIQGLSQCSSAEKLQSDKIKADLDYISQGTQQVSLISKNDVPRPSSTPAHALSPNSSSSSQKTQSCKGPLIVGAKINDKTRKPDRGDLQHLNPQATPFVPICLPQQHPKSTYHGMQSPPSELQSYPHPNNSHLYYLSVSQPRSHVLPTMTRDFNPSSRLDLDPDIHLGLDPALDPERRLRPRYFQKVKKSIHFQGKPWMDRQSTQPNPDMARIRESRNGFNEGGA